MKNKLLVVGLIFVCSLGFSQDANDILRQSYNKCQSIQNGYYEMTHLKKYMDNKDTLNTIFYCHFKKLKEDSLYSSAFHYYTDYGDDNIKIDVIYTGEDFISASSKDSTATIMSKSLWANDIKSYAHNYKFYSPLTNKTSFPLQHDSDFVNNKYIFKYLGEESVNGVLCYNIQVNEIPESESTEMMKVLREEYHFWIKKDDFIPIQYSIAYDIVMSNDTMFQYEKNILNKYELNNFSDENRLTINSIPDYYKIKDYVPYKSPELLPNDTIAPNWELYSLSNEKISLKSLHGQLVLVDFFYKSCYPCMQALPTLQALSEKYKSAGLRVIGINPFDKKEDGIAEFLSKRGVTYTVLLDGKETAKVYRVSGYPTIYLIDREGKVIFTQVGYGKDVDEILDEIVRKNL